ncbi:MAG: protein kinase [Rhabdochlamydiaceae bacterium]|nr:protein kinase [Candidatus Amphrikana amoebophyrae]
MEVYNKLAPVIRLHAWTLLFPNSEIYGLAQVLVHNEEVCFKYVGTQLNIANEEGCKPYPRLHKRVTLIGKSVKEAPVMISLEGIAIGGFKEVNLVLVLGWDGRGFTVEKFAEYKLLANRVALYYKNFIQEARLYSSIESRYILGGHSYTVVNSGSKSYLYSYYPFDLASLIDKFIESRSPQDCLWVIQSLRDTVRGLQELKYRGVIHLDIKPANILVRVVDQVAQGVIADLGSAKKIDKVSALYKKVVSQVKDEWDYSEVVKEPVFASLVAKYRNIMPSPENYLAALDKDIDELGSKEKDVWGMLRACNIALRVRYIIEGTMGYIAPEFLENHYRSADCDKYSFGTVLNSFLNSGGVMSYFSDERWVELTELGIQLCHKQPYNRPSLEKAEAVLNAAVLDLEKPVKKSIRMGGV